MNIKKLDEEIQSIQSQIDLFENNGWTATARCYKNTLLEKLALRNSILNG